MAVIQETLALADQFTSTFTSYLRQAQQASLSTEELKAVTRQVRNEAQLLTSAFNVNAAAANAQAAQIRLSRLQQQELEAQQTALSASTSALTQRVTGLVSAYAGLRGVGMLVNLSDTMTQTNARIQQMNANFKDTEGLTQRIYQSAQRSRGVYQATADLVTKLGTLAPDAFGSASEIVAFAEQVNKQMTLSGASSVGGQAAILQLTQAMSSGVLRGEELNSILEQTPTIAQTIADYMGVNVGTMREMASEGQITAEVVKNALLGAAEDTNAAFEKMPMTWGQVWSSFSNTALMAIQPVLDGINWMANNLDILVPAVGAAGTAFLIFTVAANWINICTGATKALAAAQAMLSAAMATGWALPLIAIAAVIGVVYLLVAAYNRMTGSAVSGTGIVAGAFAFLAASIYNTIVGVLNAVVQVFWTAFSVVFSVMEWIFNTLGGGFDSFGDGVANLIGQIIGWFLSLGQVITTIIDAIFGTNWTSGLDSLKNAVTSWGKNGNAVSFDLSAPKMDRIDPFAAYQSGYNWGANLFSGGVGIDEIPGMEDIPTYDQLTGIGDALAGIKKSVDLTDEDIKGLVDVATRKYVNNVNLTAQTPVITVNGANTGNTERDRQALADAIKKILLQEAAAGALRSTARVF